MSGDYEVGYGKPPKATRWRKGRSGNPTGRRKTGEAFLFEAAAILSEPVTGTTPDGGRISLGALEAAYLKLCQRALKGDDGALVRAIRVMLEILPEGEAKREKQAAEGQDAKRRLSEMIERRRARASG